MSIALVWLLIAIGSAIVEILSPLFGFIFVTGAAFVTATLAALGVGIPIQLAVFAITLLLSLVLVRPRLAGKLHAKGVPHRTDALVGKVAEVTETIDPVAGTGRVVVGGEDWAARATIQVELGAQVTITGADGIVLHVTPVEAFVQK